MLKTAPSSPPTEAPSVAADPASVGQHAPRVGPVDYVLRSLVLGIFLILSVGALYFARDFLLPISLAFLFALVLSPVVRWLKRRRVPEFLSAVALVLAMLSGIVASAYLLSGPVGEWLADAPTIGEQIRAKIAAVRQPVEAIAQASDQVEEIAKSGSASDATAQKVVISEPGLLSRAAVGVPEVATKITLALVLLLFLLASGDLFYEKVVKVLPTLSDKKRAVRILREVEREVSRYLFTISLINAGLGVTIGFAMWALGLPTPYLWGLAATFLNFIPYLGAGVGILLVAVVGLVSFDTIGQAAAPPAIYFLITLVEGQIITPMIVGRRLEMNAVAIFLAVAFWGWLWGIAGALLAVPLLVTIKVFSDHVEGIRHVGEFLAARDAPHTPGAEQGD